MTKYTPSIAKKRKRDTLRKTVWNIAYIHRMERKSIRLFMCSECFLHFNLGVGLAWSGPVWVGPGAQGSQVIARLSQERTHPANEPPHCCLQEMQDKGEGTGSVGWGGDRQYRSPRLPCDPNNKARCGSQESKATTKILLLSSFPAFFVSFLILQ